ncbi:2'-deoxycytidine 5'-triphosphate deaminase [Lichenihabitans psoromatis]|uniref:2'-deoxycytidine 5'-triphosphate deaminase n=1 Tax=Lichenihabitans psoromatis TaxID=2528642 RepID=UPI00103855E8|nr:2'-deoxycytidine 5'-triphosphate deaminase [Lichenihabitans psoromatis]
MTTSPLFPPGLLAEHQIEALAAAGAVVSTTPAAPDQHLVQPASLDLRLGTRAWRVRASFLPGPNRTVEACIASQPSHEMDLSSPVVLETGTVTIVELDETLNLPASISAATNPKSSTGRIDVFTRVITDQAREFDFVEAGYAGPLYLEVSPRSFPVRVKAGSRLSQIRFRAGQSRLDDAAHLALHRRDTLVSGSTPSIAGGVALSVDLGGFDRGLIGYRAKRHTGLIDVDTVGLYDLHDFWEPLPLRSRKELVLDPGEFYILASKEAVHVPADHAAEMVPFDPLVGEFRVHYAGFFDPGFGASEAGGTGARAVLEVRSRDVPFILEDGQIIGRLLYERLSERPKSLYGAASGSNYQAQGLKLSKHFRPD